MNTGTPGRWHPRDASMGAASQRSKDESLVRGHYMGKGLGTGEVELVGL